MADYTIRAATADDAATVTAHRRAMFEDMKAADADQLDWMAQEYEPWAREAFASGKYRGWLALDEAGNVAAGAGLALIDWPPNHLGRLAFRPVAMDVYTHPKYRRRGLARRLMEAMTAWCNANDIPYLFLHASDDGRPLYEAMGFRATTEMHLALDR